MIVNDFVTGLIIGMYLSYMIYLIHGLIKDRRKKKREDENGEEIQKTNTPDR